MRHIFVILCGSLFTACNKQTDIPPVKPLAAIQVYNAAPSYLNTTTSIAISDSTGHTDSLVATYNTVAGGAGAAFGVGAIGNAHYYYYKPGGYRVSFSDTAGHSVSAGILNMSRDQHHTVYLSDSLGYFTTIISNDDVARTDGKATIRLINLSPDAGPLDLALDSVPVTSATAIRYGQISTFAVVPVTIKSGIRVTTSGADPILLSRKSFPLETGRCYTLILRGYINPPAVPGEPLNDRLNRTISLSALINQ
jgi:hypothetical protein